MHLMFFKSVDNPCLIQVSLKFYEMIFYVYYVFCIYKVAFSRKVALIAQLLGLFDYPELQRLLEKQKQNAFFPFNF